jgi:hypothetical protein
MVVAALLISLVVLALAIGAVFAIRKGQAPSEGGGSVSLQRGADGGLVVPVTAIFQGGAHNSLNPRLAIASDGLRFKLLGESQWPFAEIERVVVASAMFGASLTFESRRSGKLVAQVRSLEVARQAAAALPPGIEVVDRSVKKAGA